LIVLIFSFIFLKITKTFSVCLMGKRPGPNVKHSAYTLQQVGVLNFFCKIFAADWPGLRAPLSSAELSQRWLGLTDIRPAVQLPTLGPRGF
jgi:hypothetical protein